MSINTFFILASRSRSRLSLLKKNKLNFIVIKPTCNEEFYKKKYLKKKYSPKKISLELSKMKAMSVSSENKNKLVIGSDTVIDYKNKMFDKAKNINLARKKIKKLSGKKHSIITSLVAYKNNKLVWSLTEKTTVKLRKLTDSDINKYLKQTRNLEYFISLSKNMFWMTFNIDFYQLIKVVINFQLMLNLFVYRKIC